MPDNTNADTILLTPEGATISPSTAGALLKAARQQVGVHLAVLSVNLKVPVRQLEALEADQYPADQSPVFARALAASMCRQLRVDPAPILALMPMSANYLEPHGAVRHAYAAPADLGRVRRASAGVPTKAWWAAGAMVVLIAVLIWAPHPSQWAWLDAVTAAVASPEPEPKSEPVTNVTAVAADANPQNAPAITDPSLSGGQGGPVPLPTVIPGTAGMPAAAASVPAVTTAAPVPELLFSALNTSWIEVRDSQNQLLWNGVLNTGDSKRLQAPQPVSVVVGRADAIQVSFKGQPLDLIPHTKVNVARFEVKP
jgi:cytoskeleton protein RodZ